MSSLGYSQDRVANSLRFYQGTGFDAINSYIRYGYLPFSDEIEVLNHIKYIDIAIRMQKMVGERVAPVTELYRGVRVDSIEDLYRNDESPIIIDKSYSSTSLSINKALEFTGDTCCLFIFQLPEGINYYKYQPSLSSQFDEREVLLERGLTYYDFQMVNKVQKNRLSANINEDLRNRFSNTNVYVCKIRKASTDELSQINQKKSGKIIFQPKEEKESEVKNNLRKRFFDSYSKDDIEEDEDLEDNKERLFDDFIDTVKIGLIKTKQAEDKYDEELNELKEEFFSYISKLYQQKQN